MAAISAWPEAINTEHFGTITIRKRLCPMCDTDNELGPANSYSHKEWPVKECSACGFVYIDRAPIYEMQFAQMAWEKTTKVEEQRRAELRPISYRTSKRTAFRKRLLPKRTIANYITSHIESGRVIDLGSGEGHVLLDLPLSFVPFGIEISSELAESGSRAFTDRGGQVINAPCVEGLKQFPESFFAAASLRSYLEHEAEPFPVLKGLYRVLQPGGFAIVKVPNYASINRRVMGRRWCGFRYPDHLNYFTPHTLVAMAEAAGFTASFGLTGRLWTSDNMWAVLTK